MMHLISIAFDDGFRRTSLKVAEIFEQFGISAGFNVIAKGGEPGYKPVDRYHDFPRGDFELWNELKERGHEVMPHGLLHLNKADLPFEEAANHIQLALDIFREKLIGFDPKKAVFNFPFNVSTPGLETWLRGKVRACRVGGDGINPLPHPDQFIIRGSLFGPGRCENDLNREIERLLMEDSGWLVYCAHGLDNEGWGPMRTDYLKRLIDRLLAIKSVKLVPAALALGNKEESNEISAQLP